MKHFVSSFGSPEGKLFCLMGSEGKLFNTTNISGQANYHRDSQKNRKKKMQYNKEYQYPCSQPWINVNFEHSPKTTD